jgi:hypothetical protein
MATRSLLALGSTLWIDPAAIIFKITPFKDLRGIDGRDWDIERRHPFKCTAKYRSIVQRYVDGLEWEQTELFTDAYARRIERDGHIAGCWTLADLAKDYRSRFDPMVEDMRRDGFRLADDKGRPHALPLFLIGRDGDVFIGNQGNHRLAIAQVIGLDRIAGKIACRHS